MKISRTRWNPSAYVAALIFGIGTSAHAVTECNVTPTNLFIGGDSSNTPSNAYLYQSWAQGGASVVLQSNINYKPFLAILLAAKTTQRTIVVRYQDDGANCMATNPSAVVGMWLN